MALAAAALVSADAVPKGIVLWPHQAQKRSDLSSAISLEFSYALPCDIVSGTNATGALVCDWSRFEALLDGIASRRHQAVIRFRYAYPPRSSAASPPRARSRASCLARAASSSRRARSRTARFCSSRRSCSRPVHRPAREAVIFGIICLLWRKKRKSSCWKSRKSGRKSKT